MQISVEQLQQLMTRGEPIYLVDVRQQWEHDTASLPGPQLLIPLDELPERVDEVQPPDGALVVTYCHHGIRSLSAAAILAQAGHARVASLAGGIDRWSLTIDPAIPRY